MHSERLWPYSERGGSDSAQHLESLHQPPEYPLSEVEREAALVFGRGLVLGQVESLEVRTGMSLEAVNKMTFMGSERTLYPDYFQTEAGKQDAAELGVEPSSPRELAEALLDVPPLINRVGEKGIAAIANRNKRWYQEQLMSRLADEPTQDVQYQEPESVIVQLHPERFLERLENLQAYRDFYRAVQQQLSHQYDAPHLHQAKRTLLHIHQAKVNTMTAQMYTHAVNLFRQLDRPAADEQEREYQRRLVACVPFLKEVQLAEAEERAERLQDLSERLAPRMDRIRFGVDLDEEGHFSPVSHELRVLVAELEDHTPEAPRATLPADVLAEMKTTRWQAPVFKDFIETLLARLDLLSAETVDAATARQRQGRAADDKWQVVITPDFDALTVHSPEGVVYVPESFDRKLLQFGPSGALPVAGHELTHVLQFEHNRRLSAQLPIIDIKGRRSATLTEMGGILYERELFEHAGLVRPSNPHYLRALEAKLNGGNAVQVARAYLDSSVGHQQLSESDLKKRRLTAVRSSRRHYRGGYETQALDYLEQELIMRSLSAYDESFRSTVAQAAAGLSLADIAALHAVDLWHLPPTPEVNPAEEVLKVYLESFRRHENKA